jgi:4-hydroxy-L-threonine phosphate dehydrogenase PdxA
MRRGVLPLRPLVFAQGFTGLPTLQVARTQIQHGTGLVLAGRGISQGFVPTIEFAFLALILGFQTAQGWAVIAA